jgi:hypothetical protein
MLPQTIPDQTVTLVPLQGRIPATGCAQDKRQCRESATVGSVPFRGGSRVNHKALRRFVAECSACDARRHMQPRRTATLILCKVLLCSCLRLRFFNGLLPGLRSARQLCLKPHGCRARHNFNSAYNLWLAI